MKFTATARRLGIFSAAATVILLVAYAVTLTVGLASLESPQQPIGDPMFTILEVLIITMMPAMVALMVAVHAWAPMHAKTLSLTSVIFMSLLAGLTCVVHFIHLDSEPSARVRRAVVVVAGLLVRVAFGRVRSGHPGLDVFFPLSMLFAAPVFRGSRLAAWIRVLMIASGVLSLAGLSGVVVGDMQVRNIGIVGYVGVFLFVAALLASCSTERHRQRPNTLFTRVSAWKGCSQKSVCGILVRMRRGPGSCSSSPA